MKKLLSIILCLSFVFSLLPCVNIPSYAEGETSGSCGSALYWSFDDTTGELSITGSGEMTSSPWNEYSDDILSLSIAYGITEIAENAFSELPYITEVELPNSITTVGDNAFENCISLCSVTFPNGSVTIGDDVFSGCDSLNELIIENGFMHRYIFDGVVNNFSYTVTYDAWEEEGHVEIKNYYGDDPFVSIPGTVLGFPVTIVSGFNYNTTLETIVFPDSVENIGMEAFKGCSNLQIIQYPNSSFIISSYAFSYCPRIKQIIFSPNTLTAQVNDHAFENSFNYNHYSHYYNDIKYKIVVGDYDTYVQIEAYEGDETELIIPDLLDGYAVKEICSNAFCNNSTIESVILPDTVTLIGESAFEGCTNLNYIKLPGDSVSIGNDAFTNCTSLVCIEKEDVDSFNNYSFSGSLNGFNYDVEFSFSSWDTFDEEMCAFITGYTGNESIVCIPSSIYGFPVVSVTGFYGSSTLEAVYLSETIRTIEPEAFKLCANLQYVQYPDNTFNIGSYAFAYCPRLDATVTSPNTLIYSISDHVFKDSFLSPVQYHYIDGFKYHLNNTNSGQQAEIVSYLGTGSELIIPNVINGVPVTRIADNAFYGKTNITSVTIPANVSEIGSHAFTNCSQLTNVTFATSNVTIGREAFWGCDFDSVNPNSTLANCTNEMAKSQTVTFNALDNNKVCRYTFYQVGSSSDTFVTTGDPLRTEFSFSVSLPGTYVFIAEDLCGNRSDPVYVTFYKTTLNPNKGKLDVDLEYIITKSGNRASFPTATRRNLVSTNKWSTEPNASSGVTSFIPTSNKTYYATWKVSPNAPTFTSLKYSFINSRSDLGYSSGAKISKESFYRIFGKSEKTNKIISSIEKEYGLTWGGSCFGICLSASLFYINEYNQLTVKKFKSSAQHNSDLGVNDSAGLTINGYNNSQQFNISLRDLIEALHVSQFAYISTQAGWNNRNNYNGLIDAVETVQYSGKPVIISIAHRVDAKTVKGHAVLGYAVKKYSDRVEISVYDPNNKTSEKTLTLTKTQGEVTGWSFPMSSGTWTNVGSEDNSIYFEEYSTYSYLWNNIKYIHDQSFDHTDYYKESVDMIITNSNDYELYQAEELVATVCDGVLSTENEKIVAVVEVNDGESTSEDNAYSMIYVPAGEYTFRNTDENIEEVELIVTDTDRSATITTTSEEISILVSDENDVNSVSAYVESGDEYDVTLSSSDDNEYDEITVSGEGTGEIITVSASAGDYTFDNCDDATIYVDGVAYDDLVDISSATASLEYTRVAYNGSEITPIASVEMNNTELLISSDYTVIYSNNTEIGTAVVKIAGKGFYKGTISLNFEILPEDFHPGDVNGDGLVNSVDLSMLKQYIAGSVSSDQIVTYNADVDGNGMIGVSDIGALRRLLAGAV